MTGPEKAPARLRDRCRWWPCSGNWPGLSAQGSPAGDSERAAGPQPLVGASEAPSACTPGEDGTGTGLVGRVLAQDPLPAAATLTACGSGLPPRLRDVAPAWTCRHAGDPACRGGPGRTLATVRPRPGRRSSVPAMPTRDARTPDPAWALARCTPRLGPVCSRAADVYIQRTLPEAHTPMLQHGGDLWAGPRTAPGAPGVPKAGLGCSGSWREQRRAFQEQGRAGAAEERGLKQRPGRWVGARWRPEGGDTGRRVQDQVQLGTPHIPDHRGALRPQLVGRNQPTLSWKRPL